LSSLMLPNTRLSLNPTLRVLSYNTKTRKELEERTIWFLKIVEKHKLCFKQLKCDINTEKIPILRVVIGRGEVQMKNNKVKAVKE